MTITNKETREDLAIGGGTPGGIAAALAAEAGRASTDVSRRELQCRRVERLDVGQQTAPFDEVADEPWADVVQYLSTKGVFRDHDIRPDALLDEDVANTWARLPAPSSRVQSTRLNGSVRYPARWTTGRTRLSR